MYNIKIHTDLEQRSAEWFSLRRLKMTASHAGTIKVAGKGLDTYITELVAESYCKPVISNYTNKDIERGIELEPEARSIYEMETGNTVKEVGFIEVIDRNIGVSPDGLVADDGLVEIKCPNNVKYFNFVRTGKIEPNYYAQMQMQMLISGRKWCDYVVYNPNFPNPIQIKRVEIDKEMVDKLEKGFIIGEELINKLQKEYEANL